MKEKNNPELAMDHTVYMPFKKLFAEKLHSKKSKIAPPQKKNHFFYFLSPKWPKLKDTWKIKVSRGYSTCGMN